MPSEDAIALYESHSFSLRSAAGETVNYGYRLLRPPQVEPRRRYPLVLFLHGAGERGSDNRAQLAYLPAWMTLPVARQKYPCFLIAPQCPDEAKWSNVDWSSKESEDLPEISQAMQAVIGILNRVVAQEPVDPQRVYLTGLSMGGYGSFDLAERMPERFAAVGAACGGGDETLADRLVGLPLWAWHGDADTAVPVERSRGMIAAIQAAGGNPKYTELKGVGHDCWTKAYTDPQGLVPWMFAERRAVE